MATAAPQRQQSRGAGDKRYCQRHGVGLLSRTPRPPEWLAASAMSSMPGARGRRQASSADRRCRGSHPRLLPCAGWSAATARPLRRAGADQCRERARGPELAGGDHRADVSELMFNTYILVTNISPKMRQSLFSRHAQHYALRGSWPAQALLAFSIWTERAHQRRRRAQNRKRAGRAYVKTRTGLPSRKPRIASTVPRRTRGNSAPTT